MRSVFTNEFGRSYGTLNNQFRQSPVHTYISHDQIQKIEIVEALRAENVNLRQAMRKQMNEYEHMRNQCALESTTAAKNDLLSRENAHLKETMNRMNNQSLTLREQIASLSAAVSQLQMHKQQNLDRQLKINDYQRKLTVSTQEIQRLNRVLATKTEQWKVCVDKLKELEAENTIMRQKGYDQMDLRVIISQQQNRIDILSQEVQRMRIDKLSFEEQSRMVQTSAHQANNRLNQLVDQNSALQNKLYQLTKSNKSLQKCVQTSKYQSERLLQMSKKQEEYHKQRSRLTDMVNSLRYQIQEKEMRISGVFQEKQKLSRQLQESYTKQAETSDNLKRISILSHEIERLNVILQNKNVQLTMENEKYLKAQEKINNLYNEMQKIKSQNSNAVEKAKNVEQQGLLNKIRAEKSSQQIEQLCLRIVQLEKEVTHVSSEKNLQGQEKIAILSMEIERLNVLIQNKTISMMEMQKKLMEMEAMGKVDKKNEQYEAQLTKISAEFNKLNQIIMELKKQNEMLRHGNTGQKKLTAEIGVILSILRQWMQEVLGYSRIGRQQPAYKSKLAEVASLLDGLHEETEALGKKLFIVEAHVDSFRRMFGVAV